MSLICSFSDSELTSVKGDEDMAQNNEKYANENSDPNFTQKTQTLDRYLRSSVMSHFSENKMRSFFASFRLNKRALGNCNDEFSSGSEFVKNHPKKRSYENLPLMQGLDSDSINDESDKDEVNINYTKHKKRYLNRMSSFVSRVANKVQIGNEGNLSIRGKLERSQTIAGNSLAPENVEYVQFERLEVPCLMGIRNHGNTCFINAIIQCLSHTDILAEYFVLDHFKSDLARCNRINSKKFGSQGEITENLATLLKSLWVLRYVPDISLNLKNVVEKYESLYKGSNQHDAAEFLLFILDKVHEDLNTASKRKYKKIKNSYGRPDEVVAAETLANHLRCNSSFVQDIFQAQFRSSLKCPHCLKESNTFDPYLCVSIPIPQHEILSMFVTVVYLNQQPKQVKIGISIEATATIKQLRHTLAMDCGIEQENLILTEIDGEGFHRTFADNVGVNIIKSSDPIYAIETHPKSTYNKDAFIHIVWMNVLPLEPSDIRFGGVYQSQVARDITYEDLQKMLLKEMSMIVTMETLLTQQERRIFLIGLDNGSEEIVILDPDLDLPLLHQSVEDCLSICHPLAGPPHIKLSLQWTHETKQRYIIDDLDHIDEHSSVEELKNKPPECAPVTLSDCLQLHTSAEMLSCGNAWHCPTCNRKQQVVKRLTLWSAPQVLVIHLKRFKQVSLGSNSSKLNTTVTYPLMDFDISDHMAGRTNMVQSAASLTNSYMGNVGAVWSSWRRNKKRSHSYTGNIYDLYAVCNHHGNDLQGGHYTAFCRNPTTGKWHSFDDFSIEEISEESIVNRDAYILFYQKRDGCPVSPSGSNHWSSRIPVTCLPPILKIIPDKPEEDMKSRGAEDDLCSSAGSEEQNNSDQKIKLLPEEKLDVSLSEAFDSSISSTNNSIATPDLSERSNDPKISNSSETQQNSNSSSDAVNSDEISSLPKKPVQSNLWNICGDVSEENNVSTVSSVKNLSPKKALGANSAKNELSNERLLINSNKEEKSVNQTNDVSIHNTLTTDKMEIVSTDKGTSHLNTEKNEASKKASWEDKSTVTAGTVLTNYNSMADERILPSTELNKLSVCSDSVKNIVQTNSFSYPVDSSRCSNIINRISNNATLTSSVLCSSESLGSGATNNSGRKSFDRLPSFMMDTVDTRDIGSLQTIVDSKRFILDRNNVEVSKRNQESEIPEVRIQPASLEKLASHKCKTQKQKMTSSKSNDGYSSHHSSMSSLSSYGSDSITSKYILETPTTIRRNHNCTEPVPNSHFEIRTSNYRKNSSSSCTANCSLRDENRRVAFRDNSPINIKRHLCDATDTSVDETKCRSSNESYIVIKAQEKICCARLIERSKKEARCRSNSPKASVYCRVEERSKIQEYTNGVPEKSTKKLSYDSKDCRHTEPKNCEKKRTNYKFEKRHYNDGASKMNGHEKSCRNYTCAETAVKGRNTYYIANERSKMKDNKNAYLTESSV